MRLCRPSHSLAVIMTYKQSEEEMGLFDFVKLLIEPQWQ